MAETFNTMLDATKDFLARQHNVGSAVQPAPLPAGMVWIRNDSGNNRVQGEVLGIEGSVFTPDYPHTQLEQFLAWPVLIGVVPVADRHIGRFVVLAEPIADGAIGRAHASGICPALVLVHNPSVPESQVQVDIIDGYTGLHPRLRGGATILWHGDLSSGPGWAIIRFTPPATEFFAKLTGYELDWGKYCRYEFTEVDKGAPGYLPQNWESTGNCRSGIAYNMLEEDQFMYINADGEQTRTINNLVVLMHEVWNRTDFTTTREYWFAAPTGAWESGYRSQSYCDAYDAWANIGP